MPYNFVNSYSPQTPIGGALSNIALGLFGGKTQREQDAEEGLSKQRAAQAGEHEARRLLIMQQAAGEMQKNEAAQRLAKARQNPVAHFANSVFGGRAPEYINYRADPEREGPPMGVDDIGDAIVGPRVPVGTPRPDWLTPQDENRVGDMINAGNAANFAGHDKNADLAKLMAAMRDARVFEGMQAGGADPRLISQANAALSGKPMASESGGVVFDPYNPGAAVIPTPVGRARIGELNAVARLRGAEAGTEPYKRRKLDAETGAEQSRGRKLDAEAAMSSLGSEIVPVPNPMAPGSTVDAFRKDVSSAAATGALNPRRGGTSTPKPKKIDRLPVGEVNAAYGPIVSMLREKFDVEDIPSEVAVRAKSMIRDLAQDPESEFYKNPDLAAEEVYHRLLEEYQPKPGTFRFGFGADNTIEKNPNFKRGRIGGRAIDKSRPAVANADGSKSTERTITIEADGRHFVIPTMINGVQLSEDDAIAAWEAGENDEVGEFTTAGAANAYAARRSNQIGEERGMGAAPAPEFVAPNGTAVSMDEILQTAKARGKTPDQVIRELGLRPPDA